jgi:HD-GYP domain-containing protein (c-di-GMP phosphodiesterase class II)
VPLRPVTLDASIIGKSLPWNLYTVTGVLVASAGLTLTDKEQLAKLTARPLFRQSAGDNDSANLGQRLLLQMESFPYTCKAAGTSQFEQAIRGHARELISLARVDHDASIGLLRLLPMADPAARHCLLTAIIALDMAEQMLAPNDPRIEAIICAALTMNIAAMRLHSDLTERRTFIDSEQRDSISRHPQDSLKLLEVSGVHDREWLTAVGQHHENLDGSGYPNGLRGEDICLAARIIRIADFYAAKIRGRRYRPAISAQAAFKHIFGDERARLDNHLALILLRRLGLYPPGTLIRLASKEIAVVMRKQGSGETPGKVIAFLSPNHRLLKEPAERNTAQIGYAFLNTAEIEPDWPEIDWKIYWGY